MATHKSGYYKGLFIIGAAWNLGMALGFMFFPKLMAPLFGLQVPADPVWFYLFFALVLAFGLGYFAVSRNLNKNRAVVGMGIIGKALVFLILGYYWRIGSIPTLAALAGVVDLVFALLFAEFLMRFKK